MSALPLRGYRVFLHTWDVYDVIIDATSQEDALTKAEALYHAEGRCGLPLCRAAPIERT